MNKEPTPTNSPDDIEKQSKQKSYYELGLYPNDGDSVSILDLVGTKGFIIDPKLIANRRGNTEATVLYYVPGHGGDVWLVEHDDDTTHSVYSVEEMAPNEAPEVEKSLEETSQTAETPESFVDDTLH